jgi:hypothetical protein
MRFVVDAAAGLVLGALCCVLAEADDAKPWTVDMTVPLVVDGATIPDARTHDPADFQPDASGRYLDADPLCRKCRPHTLGSYVHLALTSVMESERQGLDMRAREGWVAFADQIRNEKECHLTAKQIALIEDRIRRTTISPAAALAAMRLLEPNYKPQLPE